MQAHATVYKYNKLELEEKRCLLKNNHVVKDASLKDHIYRRRVGEHTSYSKKLTVHSQCN